MTVMLNIPLLFGQMPELLAINQIEADSTVDSSLVDYYPLQEGNIWQYRIRDYFGSAGRLETTIDYGDTLMLNGKTYHRLYKGIYLASNRFCRIDSLYQVQEYLSQSSVELMLSWYGPEYCDSCLLIEQEVSFFHLNEIDSTHWTTCYNIGDNLFLPGIKYMGAYNIDVFSQIKRAKLFTQYNIYYDSQSNDWIEEYGNSYILVKGIGLYYAEFQEGETAILEGAIINGIEYGNVVGVEEENKNQPAAFMLFQNYPNPFNNQTIIDFYLQKPGHIKLEIYNSLGQIVELLEDRYLPGGKYSKTFNAANLSSGIYLLRLAISNQTYTKKMILLK
jgi:hypothetical protein